MPTISKRKVSQRKVDLEKLTNAQRQHLGSAHVHPMDWYPFSDDAHRRRVWIRHKVWILTHYVGTRPQAWWDYEATEPRRLLKGRCVSSVRGPTGAFEEDLEFTPAMDQVPPRRFWNCRGRPCAYAGMWDVLWETQLEYLIRHSLANPGEREATIKAATKEWRERYENHGNPPPFPEEEELLQNWDNEH